jgi:hypothetical protein
MYDMTVVINKKVVDKSIDPYVPKKRPKKPQKIALNNGNQTVKENVQ